MRRGDAAPNRRVSDETLLRCTLAATRQCPACVVHIASEGTEHGLEWAREFGAVLHLNESLRVTFQRMVTAECLVMASRSTLSWTAGVLSQGKLFHPYPKIFGGNNRINKC